MTEEQKAITELKSMTREELDNVDYDLKKWVCQCKKCTNGTKVRDYGIAPEYYWPTKKGVWVNLSRTFFICGKHNQWTKKLIRKRYNERDIFDKIVDFSCKPESKMIPLKFERQTKINE